MRISPSNTDSSRSDGDGDAEESNEEGGSSIMLDQVLDILSRRWDRINGAQALRLLPRETKLQVCPKILSRLQSSRCSCVLVYIIIDIYVVSFHQVHH